MGILSDFVIANSNEAKDIGVSLRPADSWQTLEGWKGIETIKLSTLFCSITGEQYTNDLQKSFPLVGGNRDEGPWVFEFPEKILSCFSEISNSDIPSIAKKWVTTEELEMDGWSCSDAEMFIGQISEYAKIAETESKQLFLWLSL